MHFLWNCWKIRQIDGLPYPSQPLCVQGRALNFCISGRMSRAPHDVTRPRHSFLKGSFYLSVGSDFHKLYTHFFLAEFLRAPDVPAWHQTLQKMYPAAPVRVQRHQCGSSGTSVGPAAPVWVQRHQCGSSGTSIAGLHGSHIHVSYESNGLRKECMGRMCKSSMWRCEINSDNTLII